MKKSIIILFILIFVNSGLFAQKLNSEKFHDHRNDLKSSFSKFENLKTGRVAFLGGSITFNPGWCDSVCNYLQTQFPETKFDFINAGIPSMGSTPGAFRFERDVLKNGDVDLVFVEAAVNDETNNRSETEIVRAMEGIIRHAKRENKDCDIVMMHFADPQKIKAYRKGEIPPVIELHENIAKYYSVSTINLAKEVTERIGAGEFTWENDFKDLHPSPFGQNIYYQSIKQFLKFEQKDHNKSEEYKVFKMPEPLDEYPYSKGVLKEVNPPKPIKGWKYEKNWNPYNEIKTRQNYVDVPMLIGKYPAKVLRFPFKGNAVGIAVAAGPDAGIIEYSVDESDWKKVDLFTPWSKTLYLPWYYTLESGLKNRKHTLQIRISDKKNPESTGYRCMIRYFYFNEGE